MSAHSGSGSGPDIASDHGEPLPPLPPPAKRVRRHRAEKARDFAVAIFILTSASSDMGLWMGILFVEWLIASSDTDANRRAQQGCAGPSGCPKNAYFLFYSQT